jgi:MoaA/NifB/PqqE/SkfB family radical SAM enzyme
MNPNAALNLLYAQLLREGGWFADARNHCLMAAAAEPAEGGDIAPIRGELAEIDKALAAGEVTDLAALGHRVLAVLFNRNVLSTALFDAALSPELRRRVFRQAVGQVDLEVTSQCNRRCEYCPNSVYDRRSRNHLMDHEVFKRIVADLASIDYAQRLNFVGYNEPLMHKEVACRAVSYTRARLPHAHLCIYSNGDYLDRPCLDDLADAGLNELIVSHHLQPNQTYNEGDVLARLWQTANRLGLPLVLETYVQGERLCAVLPHERMRISVFQVNYRQHGHNRGGLLPEVGRKVAQRTAACLMPVNQFIVHHTGKVVPCCTLYSDAPEHAGAVIGEVRADGSIFDVFFGERAIAWRRGLLNNLPKTGVCATCQESDFHDPAIIEGIRASLEQWRAARSS